MNSNIHAVVLLAARQAPKSVPATFSFCQLPSAAHSRAQKHSHVMVPLLRDQRPRAYRLHCAALSCAQRRPEAQPCNGTPSCATSAQERTGLIMNSNIHAAVHQAVWRRMPLNFFLSTSCSLLPVSAMHCYTHTHSDRSGSKCQTEVPQKLQASQSADDPMSFTQFRTCLQTLLDPG